MSLKQRESIYLPLNSNPSNVFVLSGNGNLIRNKTPYYSLSIPIINKYKDVLISSSVSLRYLCAKIADIMVDSLEYFKK
jgi:hypothetical protein